MNLREIEQRAISYMHLRWNPKRLKELRAAKILTQPTEEVTQPPILSPTDRVQEILERIDAISSLEAIRDEAWGEGSIIVNAGGGKPQDWILRLESNSFRTIRMEWKNDKVEQVRLIARTTQLDITVNLHKGGNHRKPRVWLNSEGIYQLQFVHPLSAEGGKLVSRSALLKPLTVINLLADESRTSWPNRPVSFDPYSPFAQDEFCLRLHDDFFDRKNNHSFPSQIRQFSDELIGLFPPSLSQRGWMTKEEVREWEYEQRDIPGWIRFFDRRLGFLG